MSSTGYTPLSSSIVYSSVWMKSHEVLRVWIAMLALMDRHSKVYGTVPGMAHQCMMDVPTFLACEKVLMEPEPDVPNKVDDGRRIERIEGGWFVINGRRWREKFRSEARKRYQAQWAMEKRAGRHGRGRAHEDMEAVRAAQGAIIQQERASAEGGFGESFEEAR